MLALWVRMPIFIEKKGNLMPAGNHRKAVSTLIATVLLVAFVMAVAVIITNSFTNVIKTQTGAAEAESKACAGAAIVIADSSATASSFQMVVQNMGPSALTNFTITAKKADGTFYTNASVASTLSIGKSASSIITLADINSTSGCPLSLLRVSAGNCPVSNEKDNSTQSIC